MFLELYFKINLFAEQAELVFSYTVLKVLEKNYLSDELAQSLDLLKTCRKHVILLRIFILIKKIVNVIIEILLTILLEFIYL